MPLVSIGLPVFNGEKGISCALDSLINQDYKNLEIIISDNASTDATKEICACYVKKDSRVKYFRIENNLGAVWNFNRVFELASGEYFMWAAHDDKREPTFISACVEKLQISPKAVLCQVKTAIYIDGSDEIMCFNDLDSFESKIEIIERYRETLKNFPMTALYGLYRVTALKKTQRFSKSIATDVAFIQELSIHGNFIQVPSILFSYIGRAKWNTIQEDYKAISGGALKPWWYLPFIALFCNHWSRIARSSISLPTKISLWNILVEHEIKQIFIKVVISLIGQLCPKPWKAKIGIQVYRFWLNSPNVKVSCEALFLERAVKPRLGWWK